MRLKSFSYIKLGFFVLTGLILLILLLYFIGKNENLFIPSFTLKTHFKHIQGLQQGNNVRFSGVQAGSVKKIVIINDTLIEVTLTIDKAFNRIIRKNAEVSISTDGFVGNKILNISPVSIPSDLAEENDILPSKKSIDMDEMLTTLAGTNNNVAVLSTDLKNLIHDLTLNHELMQLLNSNEIPRSVKRTLYQLNATATQLRQTTLTINKVVDSALSGNGSIAEMLRDTSIYDNLQGTSDQIRDFSNKAVELANKSNQLIQDISKEIESSNMVTILRDSSLTYTLKNTLTNVEKGTSNFNQNMEALKSNFLFRGYFKKLAKKEAREKAKGTQQ